MWKKSSGLLFDICSICSARLGPIAQKKLLNSLATMEGTSDGILSTFTVKGASRLGLLGNTDRIIFQVSHAFFLFLANSV